MTTSDCVGFTGNSCPTDIHSTATAVYFFRAYIEPALILIGLPSNLFVLIIFIRLQSRNPCRFNIYVIWIAVAHIFQLIGEALLDHFIGRGLWYASGCTFSFKLDIQSVFTCKFVSYLPAATELLASSLLMTFTIDRTMTVFRPIHCRGDIHLSYARFAILGCFCCAFIAISPAAVVFNIINKGGGRCSCSLVNPNSPGARYVILMSVFCSYTIPTCVILLLNILICYKLKFILHDKEMKSRVPYRQKIERRRILGHLGVCSFFLTISLPLVITMVMRQHSDAMEYDQTDAAYHNIIVQLTKLFSSVTAIQYSSDSSIYLIFLPNVRSEALKLLCGCKCYLKCEPMRRFLEKHVKETASEKRQRCFNTSHIKSRNSTMPSTDDSIKTVASTKE